MTNLSKPAGDILLGEGRQCTATSRINGQRCKRAPIPGGTVCTIHGGSAPQTREAAIRRLGFVVEPALEQLFSLAFQPPACEVCGREERPDISYKATVAILDRFGLVAGLNLNVSRGPDQPVRQLSNEQLLQEAQLLVRNLTEVVQREQQQPVLPPAPAPQPEEDAYIVEIEPS